MQFIVELEQGLRSLLNHLVLVQRLGEGFAERLGLELLSRVVDQFLERVIFALDTDELVAA